jgi:hypothetical protein
MLALMLTWPLYFFPFVWLSVFFILEPINVWLGNRSLAERTAKGDWRTLYALWIGVLITGFFWEMWNYYAYPKWEYHVPFVGFGKIFEMPFLGYGGYLPFAMELYALYHLIVGLGGDKRTNYVQILDDKTGLNRSGVCPLTVAYAALSSDCNFQVDETQVNLEPQFAQNFAPSL